MAKFYDKITSRKFLTAVAGVVMGLAMVFGLDGGAIETVAGAVTALASVVTYIITEGKVDAEAVDKAQEAAGAVQDAVDKLGEVTDDAAD